MITLRKKAKGTAVMVLQHLLNIVLHSSLHLKIDGDYGKNTYDAVVKAQQYFKIKVDGTVGKNTWKALGMTEAFFPVLINNSVTTTNWMPIAKTEKGIREILKPGQHHKRIIEYHSTTMLKATTDETPWCSSFVNWVVIKAGYKGTNNALAKSWLKWGKELKIPREGAIVIVKKKNKKSDAETGSSTGFHVAFFVRKSATHITLLGGNQGDQVKESNYRLSSYNIEGYRWPI